MKSVFSRYAYQSLRVSVATLLAPPFLKVDKVEGYKDIFPTINNKMRRTHLIPNPSYNQYDSTCIRCGDGIHNIIRKWSPEQLVKFDNFLIQHSFNTTHEQIVHEVCTTTPYIVERYNELVEQVNAVNRSCREMRGDESKIVEYEALKKSRAKLVKTLQSTFKKSGAKYPPFHF